MKILNDIDITYLTTFGVPVRAACVCQWSTAEDLIDLSRCPRPLKFVGGGSNLLFTGDFQGTVFTRVSVPQVELRGRRVIADAHIELDALCHLTAAAGLRGMENLSGIPGTLGGALVQNAGAYGAETGEFLRSATLFDLEDNCLMTVDRPWMQFAYRTSRLKSAGGRYVVISAELELLSPDSEARLDYGNLRHALEGKNPTPMAVRRTVLATRAAKLPDPADTGSAGSFFRNPEVDPSMVPDGAPHFELPNGLVKVPAAWLIDRCGLKGARCGGAATWPSQPLVIVNAEGSATAADVLELEHYIINTVSSRFGITLVPEVEHL